MRPIRILHVSDLHLAEQPERHSVIDKSGAVKKAVRDLLARDVKEAILSGQAKNIKPALQRFLDEESVAALVGAVSLVDRCELTTVRVDSQGCGANPGLDLANAFSVIQRFASPVVSCGGALT
jgi:hypothetical protein